VTGYGSKKMMALSSQGTENGNLFFADIDDSSLNNQKDGEGESIYTFRELDPAKYPGFSHGWGSTETTASKAILYVKKDWIAKNGDLWKKLSKAILLARPQIKQKYGGLD
jgi:hypothetical protein